MTSERWFPTLAMAAAVLVALAYLPVLNADYVWDDWQLFINTPALRLPELLWPALWEPILPGTSYLRPVALASFAGQFMTVGIDPGIAHGVNLFLHAANTLLVGLIAIRLTAAARLPARAARIFLAALLYGLHPALVEAVAWVSGRFDLLVTLFALLALWGYLVWAGWRRDLWVMACFLLAAFSKEMAATLPAVLFLFYLGRQGPQAPWRALVSSFWRDREWRLYVLLACVAVLVVGLRQALLGHLTHQDSAVNSDLEGFWHHLAFIGQTFLFYAKTSLWPFVGLGPQHPFDAAGMTGAARLGGVLAIAAGLAFLGFALWRRVWPALLVAGWGIALLPVLNVLPLTINGSIGSERFLALPLVFLVLGLATLRPPAVSPAMRRALPVLTGTFAALLFAAALANIRITLPLWQNDLSLWAWSYVRYPDFPGVQANYAAVATRFGELGRAQAVFDRVEATKGNESGKMTTRQAAMLKLVEGEYLLKANQAAQALVAFNDALDLSPTPPHELLRSEGLEPKDIASIHVDDATYFYRTIYWDFAVTQVTLGHFAEGLEAAQASLLYAPTYAQAWLLKAFALYGLDRWEEGEDAFAQADRYYTDDGQLEAQESRAGVLKQLCAKPTPPALVCGHWQRSAGQASAAHLP